MFGGPPKCGLADINLPPHAYADLDSEEQLEQLLIPEAHDDEEPERNTDPDGAMPSDAEINQELESPQSDAEPVPGWVIEVHPICVSCDLHVTDGVQCQECSNPVHSDERCSITQQDEPRSSPEIPNQLCIICSTKRNTSTIRLHAYSSMKRQADRMIENTNKRLKTGTIGETVLIPIPDVDRGRGEHRNIKGVIMSEADGFFKIGTVHGRLNGSYTRNQFLVCSEGFLDISAIPDAEISLREAAKKSAVGTGQGYFHCGCLKGCYGRCKCKRAGKLCTSKCHKNSSCGNKNDPS